MSESLVTVAENILIAAQEARKVAPEIKERLYQEVAHGFDTRRWVNRLEPAASEELRAAGVLHDLERVINHGTLKGFEGDRSLPDYQPYKEQHAFISGGMIWDALKKAGVDSWSAARVAMIATFHDHLYQKVQRLNDHEIEVLIAADTFAYFTSVAKYMFERQGEESVREKIYFMISKLPPAYRDKLAHLRLANPQYGLEPALAKLLMKLKLEGLKAVGSNR